MEHRHLTSDGGYSLTAMDDIVVRGDMQAWFGMRDYLKGNPERMDKAYNMFKSRLDDEYASIDRYMVWIHWIDYHRQEVSHES